MAVPYSFVTHDALTTTTGDATVRFTVGAGSDFAEINAAPHRNFVSAAGTLKVYWDGETREFPDCIISSRDRSAGDSTQLSYRIKNRLWRWEVGRSTISGWYNRRRPDGTIIEESEKSPRELAKLCLDALEESGVDLEQLPDQERPETIWDHVRPFEALMQVLQQGGCRHVYCPDDKVRVVRLGVGRELPREDTINPIDEGVDDIARPDSIELVCGKTLWELTFELEAVGLDSEDDKIKLIDDLSYKPDDVEWKDMFPGEWEIAAADAINPTEEEEKTLRYAHQTVYRWFRIKGLADGTKDVKFFTGDKEYKKDDEIGEVKELDQFELRSVLVDTKTDFDGSEQPVPAYLEGEFVDEHGENTAAGTRYDGGFSIDPKSLVVKLSEVAWRQVEEDGETKSYPAKLYLRTSCWIRTNDDRSPIRYTRVRNLGRELDTGHFPIPQEEIVRTIDVPYDLEDGEYVRGEEELNDEQIEEQAELYLDAHEARFEVRLSQVVHQNGFVATIPDGAIQQVTWTQSGGVATTTTSRNNQHDVLVPSFEVITKHLEEQYKKKQLDQIDKNLQNNNKTDDYGNTVFYA